VAKQRSVRQGGCLFTYDHNFCTLRPSFWRFTFDVDMSYGESSYNSTDGVENEIIKIAGQLRADLNRKAQFEYLKDFAQSNNQFTKIDAENSPNYQTLVTQFNTECKESIDMLEVHGSEISFASAMEALIDAINQWNRHIYSRIRAGRGQICRGTSIDGSETVGLSVYTWESAEDMIMGDYMQQFDRWSDLMVACESSPLRTMQSMQYVLEYYETLVGEVISTYNHARNVGNMNYRDQQQTEKLLQELQSRTSQIEFGFQTDGAAWEEKRLSKNRDVLRREREEIQLALELEERQKQAKRDCAEQRAREQRILKEQREQAEREAEERRLQAQRLNEERQSKNREIREFEAARIQNRVLRLRIRGESQKLGANEGSESISNPTSEEPLLPFAVFDDDDWRYSSSTVNDHGQEKVPPWPRGPQKP
jgi:hypothetical protein